MQLDQANFKKKIVSSFLAADISLHVLNHPVLKSLFVAIGKSLPSEIAARASVAQLVSQKEENFLELLREKKYFGLWMKQKWISKNTSMYLWAGWILQIKHLVLSAFHLKAEAMLIAVLFYTLWMTYCDNLGLNEKILHCS